MKTVLRKMLSTTFGLALTLAACQSTVTEPNSEAPSDGPPEEEPGGRGGRRDKPNETPPVIPTEPVPECQLGLSWDVAPRSTCTAKTAVCLDKAKSVAEVNACLAADSGCGDCYSDVVLACLVGTPGKPGVCAEQAGCVDSCLASACGLSAPENCRYDALTKGECKDVSGGLQKCLTSADQSPCVARFRNECVPKVSCGNGVVEAGELCDGNCPTSCPPTAAGDACNVSTLKGNAATCSAYCSVQSKCPLGCPSNAAPISKTGVIASGSDLPMPNMVSWPALSKLQSKGCPSTLAPSSQVIAWRAPAAGSYLFSGTCGVLWSYKQVGLKDTFQRGIPCIRRVALARGGQCAPGVEPFACSLDVDQPSQQGNYPDDSALAPVTLAAGEEVLVAVNFGVNSLPPESDKYTYGGHVSFSSWSVSACARKCDGKTCGSDGCGGTCGTCGAGKTCTAAGQCQCVPQCGGKTCGSDGCGGTCGTCGAGTACTAAGQCKSTCVPSCKGKMCGSDGCGGSCGTCGAAEYCNASSKCVTSGACNPVSNTGCSAPNQCLTLSNGSTQCALMGTGGQGSACGSSVDCRGGHGCFAGTCRKICDVISGAGCKFGESCAPINGWPKLGACSE